LYFNPSIKFKSIEQEIDDLFNSTAAVKKILDYFYSEEIVICADKDMLLTRNLITNALKFTNEGGKIVVFARVNSNQIEITVSDNGIGISEDVKGKYSR
jgi:signal transduction histidine kinase